MQCIKINTSWSKGYARKGAALHGSKQYDEAIAAYEEGLKLEDSPALRKGLKEVQDAKGTASREGSKVNPLTFSHPAHDSSNEGLGLGKLFSDPNLLGKLATNPRTAKHLADPSFRQRLEFIQTNPSLAESMLSGDPRLIDVLGVLMGIDMQGFNRPEGSDDLPPGVVPGTIPDPPSSPPKKSPSPQASSSKPSPPPQPAKVEEVVEMQVDEDDDDDEVKARKEAEAEKKLGAEAYKKRDFDVAVTHFSKAWDVWPKDITFLTNLGGLSMPPGLHPQFLTLSFRSRLLRTRQL